MMRRLAAAAFVSIAMVAALPLSGADQLVDFQPGGYIHVDHSYGYLTVEGWDEPKVEVTVTGPSGGADPVQVVAKRLSDKELTITITPPARRGFPLSIFSSPPFHRTAPLDCTVHVPRDSRVAIHHDYGYVWVSDVRGGVETDSHTGDMTILLPDPGPYSIDARTGLGSISSDLTVRGNKRLLVGSRFVHAEQDPSQRIVLRMGRGSITIKRGPPSGPFWKD
jgi:hypothetical protein